jgi:hypothetical protein
VVFFIIILAGLYLYFVDPFGIKTTFSETETPRTETSTETNNDKNPALSPAQEKALETFGIDPATVPTSVTPEQEACFVEKLGQQRVDEIKAGDSPTAAEFFKAKSCI